MSKKYLFVSNDLSAINDPDSSRFVALGEVLYEQYEKIGGDDEFPAFGYWEIEVDCGIDNVQAHCPEGRQQVFRIAGDTESLSRKGEWTVFTPPDDFNDQFRPIWLGIDTLPDDPVRHTIAVKIT